MSTKRKLPKRLTLLPAEDGSKRIIRLDVWDEAVRRYNLHTSLVGALQKVYDHAEHLTGGDWALVAGVLKEAQAR